MEESVGRRLDQFVAEQMPNATRAEAQRLIEREEDDTYGIRVNARRVRSNYRLRLGDRVVGLRPPAMPTTAQPEAIEIPIVYEDEDLLVINKPRGMVVHPAPGSESGTLVNAILAHADDLSGIGGEERPGIVHRLDKDTGGLLVVAKNDIAHRNLQAQIQSRVAERRYLALVWGLPSFQKATVEAPIGRHPTDRKRMAVLTDARATARDAITELEKSRTYCGTFALLEAKLQTGRTHQIRVHCEYIHHPIVGDPTYGGTRKVPSQPFTTAQRSRIEAAIQHLNGQALHAYSLAFNHPASGSRLQFDAPLPESMDALLRLLDELDSAPSV